MERQLLLANSNESAINSSLAIIYYNKCKYSVCVCRRARTNDRWAAMKRIRKYTPSLEQLTKCNAALRDKEETKNTKTAEIRRLGRITRTKTRRSTTKRTQAKQTEVI